MTSLYLGTAILLLLTVVVGLYRVVRGPAPADRMIAAQLFGTTGLAIVLLLGAATDQPAAVDIAVVFAVLAALAAVVFVRCGDGFAGRDPERGEGERE